MTKDLLQKELLEKVKPGMKPSDLKKQVKSQIPVNQDEGYESDKSDKSVPAAPPLPNQQKDLQAQINSLQKQLEVYKSSKEADLKIKEGYKENINRLQEENSALKQTIETLKNPAKSLAEPQSQETKTFLCSDCQQTKPSPELSRVFNNFSFCLACSKKARLQAQQEKSEPTNFLCHSCEQTKTEQPIKMKLDQTLQEYSICSTCRPTLKEFNEADLITDDLWEKYPYSSASEILEKEFGIKKEEPW